MFSNKFYIKVFLPFDRRDKKAQTSLADVWGDSRGQGLHNQLATDKN